MTLRLARGTPWFVGVLWLLPVVVRGAPARLATAALAAGTTWFFRDPDRSPDSDGLVAAADGVIRSVEADEPDRQTLSTYLDLLDVHVTRAPCDAVVMEQTYRPGHHHRASSRTAHTNERLQWRLATEHGEIVLTQYAGAVARRIVAYCSVGDRVRRGQRIGLIRFGSRVDLTFPEQLRVTVRVGNRLRGGATVVATTTEPV